MKRRLLIFALVNLTVGLMCSCSKTEPAISVTGITLDKTTLEITVGDPDVKITATIHPENATEKTIIWETSDSNIATVDQDGHVHAVAVGTAIITVTSTDGNKTASCTVTVKEANIPVTDVTLDKTTIEIPVGDSDVQLTATIHPENATEKTIIWETSDSNIATVDQDGHVHALAAGMATVTVTSTDGSKTATCTVTVKAAAAGAIKGVFSVSNDEGATIKKVYFSQGNLYYDGSKFNFEDNQYDVPENGDWSTDHISHFYWSRDARVAYSEKYDEANTTYEIIPSINDVFFTNKTEATAKDDFTVNVGGEEQRGWRTLSTWEWQYLFITESRMVNGKPCYSCDDSGVVIEGKTYKGVFLYPDNYNGDVVSDDMTWEQINAAGIVFLPAAGYRGFSGIYDVGEEGRYWSSTVDPYENLPKRAWCVEFDFNYIHIFLSTLRDVTHSVRLITECQ